MKQVELHGVEGLPFEDWANDEIAYLERVTVPTRDRAIDILCREFSLRRDEADPQPIHMRWVIRETEPDLFVDMEFEDSGWLLCDADHPHAVPFWKDAP